MVHRFQTRVYYEDTDLAGIVYYANYLKFIERARSEWVRELGIDQKTLKADTGVVFAVRRLVADYLRAAVYDDLLEVRTAPKSVTAARIVLAQSVWRGEEALFEAEVTLVCLNATGAASRLPEVLRSRFMASLPAA
jgi:acyl-CoA thioester hydrolase